MEGYRPSIPTGYPEDYLQLMKDCWQDDPAARPSFGLIARKLIEM